MFPHIVKRDYALKSDDSTNYVFPITGLLINDKLTIGDVTFYNFNKLDYEKDKNLQVFAEHMNSLSTVNTIVYVDVSNVSSEWKDKCNNNLSIALMLIKQTIGLLYLTYYEYKGYEDQKRIIISENNIHECEEGMGIFLANRSIECSNVSNNLWLRLNNEFLYLLNSRI